MNKCILSGKVIFGENISNKITHLTKDSLLNDYFVHILD